jgi:Mg-chelatase subunit ChlD
MLRNRNAFHSPARSSESRKPQSNKHLRRNQRTRAAIGRALAILGFLIEVENENEKSTYRRDKPMISATRQKRSLRGTKPRRGAIIILFAVMLVVVLAMVALSVDLGYVCTVRTDLQAAADAAALAGTGVILDGESKAIATADRYARLNLNNQGVRTNGKPNVDVQVGNWNRSNRTFRPGRRPLNSVKVVTRMENNSLFFARATGKSNFSSEAKAVATYQPRDIMLVLDVSGSMAESRNGIRKIDELRQSVVAFLGYIREANGRDRIGFSYYSSTAHLGSQMSYNLDKVEKEMMKRLRPGSGTNIADGMFLGIEELSNNARTEAASLMVVLTDGAANTNQPGNWYDPTEAKRRVIVQAEDARTKKIPVFTIALDSLTEEVDVALMQRVANITGSESYHIISGERGAGGNPSLREAFRRVAMNRPLRLVD